ncbi:hypothetical protein REPUB_Repub15cG0130100 [Reevesia pubescens]
MADQHPPQNKPFTGQLLSNGETIFRIVGRFGNVNFDDEPDETKAEDSSSKTHNSTDKNQKNAEVMIRYLMERKKEEEGNVEPSLAQYEELWKAIVHEDWKEVKKQLELLDNHALISPITAFYETILHILPWPLSIAAYVGNTKAAKMMARKNPELLMRFNYSGDSPFHAAARFGHEETIRCLLSVAQTTQIDDQSFFSGDNGATIVQYLISANLFGIALDMLKRYPKLGRDNLKQRKRILKQLAEKPLGFQSGRKFGPWERLIYKVPNVERIYKTKLMNEQALQLVKSMCAGVVWTFDEASYALKLPVLKAASLGIQEIVQEILKVYTASIMFYDENNYYNIFQLAVLHRREKVFNLIYKMGLSQKWVASYPSKDKENILHLAGMCIPSRHINGAALQMQREMQWFKAVERFVHPLLLEERNDEKKTPREVFDDEHKELVKEGEKWMRDTATSCMVVDALIIAMVFAAIIAAPGNNEKGIPNFRHENLFNVFVIADAVALFSSSFSLLLFIRILTSRYAEGDFLKALPKSNHVGTSSSALIMLIDAVPGPKVMLRRSTVIPVTIMAILPVVFFTWSQSPFLIDVLISTYRPTILYDD